MHTINYIIINLMNWSFVTVFKTYRHCLAQHTNLTHDLLKTIPESSIYLKYKDVIKLL